MVRKYELIDVIYEVREHVLRNNDPYATDEEILQSIMMLVEDTLIKTKRLKKEEAIWG